MPKKEPKLRFKSGTTSAVGTRATVVSSPVDHGSLTGLGDDDHGAIYPAIGQTESITGDWTFSGTVDLSGGTISLDCAAPDADSVDVSASTEGSNTTYSRSDHTHNLDESIAPTWTSGHTFQATMTTRDLLPEAQDSYDLGSSTYWYNQMFVSQINAAVFAEEQIALLGGWLYVSHDAGTFAAEVESADTTIDFGKAMTVSDFVIVKAYDITGSVKTEYIQVGALSAGTTYNVTRDLAAAHGTDPNWAAGTPFAVLGQTGDGRIELNAYDTPRIQIIVQDDAVTYSNTTEYLRIGDMNGAFGSDAADEWGLGVGDYSGGNYLAYNTTDGFEVMAGDGAVRLDDSGVRLLETGTATSYISWKETSFSGDTIAYMTTTWNGGAADPINFYLASYKATGLSAGDASAGFAAVDVDASTSCTLTLVSDGTSRLDQAGADDEILDFRSSDVAHGTTDFAPSSNSYGTFGKAEGAAGGLTIRGYKDSDGAAGYAMNVEGWLDENADTTKSTAGIGINTYYATQTSGTGRADLVADGNAHVFRCRRGSANVTLAIIDEDGDLHLDGSNAGTFDEHDDALAVSDLAQVLAQNWNNTIGYNWDALREMGVISGGDRERPFISTKKLNALMMGAIGQLYERCQELEGRLALLTP